MSLNASTAVPQATRRSWSLRDKMLRLGLLMLGVLLVIEWTSNRSYEAALKGMESKIISGRNLPTDPAPLLKEFAEDATGLVSRRELKQGSSKFVEFSWPSVLRTYSLRLRVDDQQRVTEMQSGVYSPEDFGDKAAAPPARLANKPIPGVASPKIEGFTKAHPSAIQLDFEEHAHQHSQSAIDNLTRELIRQAILIAAREELGLATFDLMLQEHTDQHPREEIHRLPESLTLEKNAKNEIVATLANRDWRVGPQPLWTGSLTAPTVETLEDFVTVCAKLSQDEFPKALRKAGFQSALSKNTTPPAKSPVEAPTTYDYLALYDRLRKQHAQRRAGDVAVESELARSYALLGSVMEFSWDILPTVAQARGLLYAERAMLAEPSADHRAARAYTRTLVGRLSAAENDLQKLENLAHQDQHPWLPILRTYCLPDAKPVNVEDLTPSLRLLATHLRMSAAAIYASQDDRRAITQELLVLDPLHTRAQAMLGGEAPLALGHTLHAQQFLDTSRHLAETLRHSDLLSEDLRKSLSAHPTDLEAAVQQRLAIAKEWRQVARNPNRQIEPSPAWLASCLEAQNFREANEWLRFFHSQLGSENSRLEKGLLPLVEQSPYVCYYQMASWDPQVRYQALRNFSFPPHTTRATAISAVQHVWAISGNDRYWGNRVYNQLAARAPFLWQDQSRLYHVEDEPAKRAKILTNLQQIAPHSLITLIGSLKSDWANQQSRIRELEEQYRQSAIVQSALAEEYRADLNHEGADRCYQRLIELDPSPAHLNQRASLAFYNGDMDTYVAFKKAILQMRSLDLSAPMAAMDLSRVYLLQNQADTALPYAERAADSYSAWGLLEALRCHEILGDRKKAGDLYQAMAERYESHGLEWYLWCKATGLGRPYQARQMAEKEISKALEWQHPVLKIPSADALHQRGHLTRLTEGPAAAYAVVKDHLEKSSTQQLFLYAAIWAHEAGQTADRDAALQKAYDLGDIYEPYYSWEFIHHLRAILIGQAHPPQTVADCHWQIESTAGSASRTSHYYFAGKAHVLAGHQDAAMEFFRIAATSSDSHLYTALLSAIELRNLGESRGVKRFFQFPEEFGRAYDYRNSARVFQEQKDFRRALLHYNKAIELAPQRPALWANRADFHLARDEYDQAISDLTQAIALAPEIAELYRRRGEIYAKEFRDQEALADLQKALELGSPHLSVPVTLATILACSSQDGMRNLVQAREMAERLPTKDFRNRWQKPAVEALIQAEAGEFEEALSQNALALKNSPPFELRKELEARAKQFGGRQVYRRPTAP